jgi:uncharacterized protein
MTPQERQLIDDLFNRLTRLENAPRDSEAMSAIMRGLQKAPNAVYALVQTTLVQDEALKQADSRIQELEAAIGQQQNQPAGFLDSMRDTIFGQSQQHGQGQGSVPNVRAPGIGDGRPAWNTGQVLPQGQPGGQYGQPAYGQPYGAQPPQQQPAFGGGGGSFLGTAAAAAVGVVGGSMLASSLRSMMGGGSGNQQSFGDTANHSGGIEDRRPWGGDQSGGNLAREAGINDIGSSGQRADNSDSGSRQGFFDQGSYDDDGDDMDHDGDGFDGDGDGDYA